MRRPWEEAEPAGVYLDWNATTPPHPDVIDAMRAAAQAAWGNPASVHRTGRRARGTVEGLREALAAALAVSARDVLLTSGGTEANNLALTHAAALVTSRLEHPSVVRVAERLEQEGRPVRWLPVLPSGSVEPAALPELARGLPAGAWLAIQAANHETGVIQPVAELTESAHALGLRVHVDAVQAFGKLHASAWSAADSVAVTAHKIRGPKGIGALAWRGAASPRPLLVGGSQERGLRPGTVDAVAAAGFWVAVELAHGTPGRWAELARLRDELEQTLGGVADVNGLGPRLSHVTNLSFRGCRGDELVAALDLLGVHVASGSACSAGTAEPSPVVTAMAGSERALSAVRISLGETVTDDQVAFAKRAIFQALAGARAALSCDG